LLLLTLIAGSAHSEDKGGVQPLFVNVVYPLEGATIAARDSTFIFGQVTPGARLRINGYQVEVHENGAYLAFLPIEAGDFVFHLEAQNAVGAITKDLNVRVPEARIVALDSLAITDMTPSREMTLTAPAAPPLSPFPE